MLRARNRRWFAQRFAKPTEVQTLGWPHITTQSHTLLFAPTGSGKTLAAFLSCIDRLCNQPGPLAQDQAQKDVGVRVVYISPLKALAYDVERNLEAPIQGICADTTTLHTPTVAIRTGDTPPGERRRQRRAPSDILVTTPESLFLLLNSAARETLRSVETVIVDEIHAVANTKRGAHLSISLERLSHLAKQEPQRIGLSATQRPLEEMAKFLAGDRDVAIVDTGTSSKLHVEVDIPVANMKTESSNPTSIWPAVYEQLLAIIREHQSTIVFVNNRRLAEVLAQELNELAKESLVRAHHGSISKHHRREIETLLKQGEVRGLIATSSLELGIDMGAVDYVVQIESPGSVAAGLQRIGRAGHSVGETSYGKIIPKFRGDLLEAAVVAQGMVKRAIEPVNVPQNPLDVLAQQIVAMCTTSDWPIDGMFCLLQRSYNYHSLTRDTLIDILDMLSGRYPSDEFAELRPRILWNRTTNIVSARRGATMVVALNAGTIPDRGLYAVHLGAKGPRIGELDEEMVHETRPGETFILGASSWAVEEITRDRVIVVPAPGEPGKLPFWRGERVGRPIAVGRAMGAFLRNLDLGSTDSTDSTDNAKTLSAQTPLTLRGARDLLAYVREQRDTTGTLPTDRAITVEQFRDELGDWRVCILSSLGRQVHAPWALAIEQTLTNNATSKIKPQLLASDDGIIIRFPDADKIPDVNLLFPDPDDVEHLVRAQLGESALFAARFREAAARALLLPRRRAGARMPLWGQRLRAQNLMAVAKQFPSFPIILETYRECLADVFDVAALKDVLRQIRLGTIHTDIVETKSASPFSQSLVFAYVAAFLYDGDAPVAERQAQALRLDQPMLDKLLGKPALRTLLEPDAIASVENGLKAKAQSVTSADQLHDLLRRVGDLNREQLDRVCTHDATTLLAELAMHHRIVEINLGGHRRYIAIEDASRYRDAFGIHMPDTVPPVFLEPTPNPLQSLIARWSRHNGPFVPQQCAHHFDMPTVDVTRVLETLRIDGRLARGEFRPGQRGTDWCNPDVLALLKRATISKLRKTIAPVNAVTFAQFSAGWHKIHPQGLGGLAGLRNALDQLTGIAIPLSQLETAILPARVPDYQPRMLDEVGQSGEFVWIGHGSIGANDGRIAWYKRSQVGALLATTCAQPEKLPPLYQTILSHLREHGACFHTDLQEACKSVTTRDLFAALWDLSWLGQITNDSVQPLRIAGVRRHPRTKARRYPARDAFSGIGGRWCTTESLVDPSASATEQSLRWAQVLLRRHGVVGRDTVASESLPGGFTPVYRVFNTMEQVGKVRRGHFVDGLSSAQFARPNAVERLRNQREPSVVALATIDPANPYGALLPWPPTTIESVRPSRRSGVGLVMHSGKPILLYESKSRLYTFADLTEDERKSAAQNGLPQLLRLRPRNRLSIQTIDDQPARNHPLAALLRTVNFHDEYRSLVLEPS